MNPRVWVTNDVGHDYSQAQKFGELVFLTRGKVNIFSTSRLIQEVILILERSSPQDFLIISGTGTLACIVFTILMLKHRVVNLLIYSFKHDNYEVRTIKKDHLKKEDACQQPNQ